MYFPPQDVADTAVLTARGEALITVNVAGSGDIKAIYQAPPTDTAPVILFFHGNGSAAHYYNAYFDDFQRWGYGYLAAEYPGYAGSPGTPTEDSLLRAGQAHYDTLMARGIAPEQIYIFGHSLGAALAVNTAKNNPTKALILGAPFLSMQDMARRQMPFFPTRYLIKDTYRSDKRIARIDAPILILHGTDDGVVPIAAGKALYALAPDGNGENGKKTFIAIEHGHHDFWSTKGPQRIQQFIAAHAEPTP